MTSCAFEIDRVSGSGRAKYKRMRIIRQYPYDAGSALTLQRIILRENPTYILTLVARWVDDIVSGTNRHPRSEIESNRHTDTDKPGYPTTVPSLRMRAEGTKN